MSQRIYLDSNATTPLSPEVLDTVIETLKNSFGNPSSVHYYGQQSKSILIKAREVIASYLGVRPQELIFTSSGTEALNLCIRGLFGFSPRGHIITSNLEHAAVFNTVKVLEAAGCEVTYLEGGLYGAVSSEQVERAILPTTKLITLMSVNNETGVKTDIEGVARVALQRDIPFIVDGVAWLGKESFQIPDGVSAICFSGHKLHAPKGVGIACIRKGLKLTPYLTGGHQERALRAGTEDLAAIAGMAKAIELTKEALPLASTTMRELRDYFERELMARVAGVTINGTGPRICNTSNLAFDGIEGEMLLMQLDQQAVYASHGSACSTGSLEPSRILLNMGLTREKAASSLRFSLSRYTTQEEIEMAIERIASCVQRLRQI